MDVNIKVYGFKKSLPIEIEVKDLGEVKKSPHLFRGPAKADFYQLIWLTEGEAVFKVDLRNITIRQGELFIISANQVYGFDLISSYKGKMILFTGSFFSHTELDSHFLHTSDILNPVELNRTVKLQLLFLENVISLMQEELSRPIDFIQPYIAQSFLRILLLEAER
ncbi:MAG: AraC family ligand binding domain-containing protein [Bacteroides sp.]|nr:AraC family ligand binding domain-containing protein [Bacteroides sp.]